MKNELTTRFMISLALTLISLASFNWQIDDPTGELEAGSVYWGFPLPWIKTGPFYAGYLGEYVKKVGIVHMFDEGTLSYPRPLLVGLVFDIVFYFFVVSIIKLLIEYTITRFKIFTESHARH